MITVRFIWHEIDDTDCLDDEDFQNLQQAIDALPGTLQGCVESVVSLDLYLFPAGLDYDHDSPSQVSLSNLQYVDSISR